MYQAYTFKQNMRLKIFILVIIILLLCGCNVNYELDINDDNITERITLKFEDEECEFDGTTCEQTFEDALEQGINQGIYPDYELYFEKEGNENTVVLTYTYTNIEELKDNEIYSNAFRERNFSKNKFELKNLSIPEEEVNIETFNIKITSSKLIKNSNAKKINKFTNTHSWNFTKEDDGENLIFELYENKNDWFSKLFSKHPYMFYITIIFSIVLILGIIVIIFYKKIKYRNIV